MQPLAIDLFCERNAFSSSSSSSFEGEMSGPPATQLRKMPRTTAELHKWLSDATVAGYCAGFNDKHSTERSAVPDRTRIRRAIRAEIQRWLKG